MDIFVHAPFCRLPRPLPVKVTQIGASSSSFVSPQVASRRDASPRLR
jgi:hypothetical protein